LEDAEILTDGRACEHVLFGVFPRGDEIEGEVFEQEPSRAEF
jgi:hypothetical protein